MKKTHVSGTLILLIICLMTFGCGQAIPQTPTTPKFKVITAPLSLNEEEENATIIPYGSVIYHWANGITEVYGPDNERIFIARDSEATMIADTGELKPATHIYHIPSGSLVDLAALPPPWDEGSKIAKVYLRDEGLILTVIEKSEDFVAVSGGG